MCANGVDYVSDVPGLPDGLLIQSGDRADGVHPTLLSVGGGYVHVDSTPSRVLVIARYTPLCIFLFDFI